MNIFLIKDYLNQTPKPTAHKWLAVLANRTKRSLAHTQLRALSERQLYDIGLNRSQAEFDLR